MVELRSFLVLSFFRYITESTFLFLPPAINIETWFDLEKPYYASEKFLIVVPINI